MLDPVHIEKILESWDSEPTYRIVEASGKLCDCWLPGFENPDPEGPLDRGGFDHEADAIAFARNAAAKVEHAQMSFEKFSALVLQRRRAS